MPAESWLGRTLSEVFPGARLGELVRLLSSSDSRPARGLKDCEIWLHAAGSMAAISSVVMTYFGVNYFLSGLHSYAAGDAAALRQATTEATRKAAWDAVAAVATGVLGK